MKRSIWIKIFGLFLLILMCTCSIQAQSLITDTLHANPIYLQGKNISLSNADKKSETRVKRKRILHSRASKRKKQYFPMGCPDF